MTINGVKTRAKKASKAGKELKKNPNKLIKQLAGGVLVNAKKGTK
ncbi:MAG: hypothetical protein WA347_05255 [Rhabdochlamydiaceae bacterium]|jgi:hypothetical protein